MMVYKGRKYNTVMLYILSQKNKFYFEIHMEMHTVEWYLFSNNLPQQNSHCINVTFCVRLIVTILPDFGWYVGDGSSLSVRFAVRRVVTRV